MMPEFIDWNNFKAEYPWVEGEAKDWLAQLSNQLAPIFARLDR
jgi:hypothetical protein